MIEQTPNPPLEILLPRLRAAFQRVGLSVEVIASFLAAIKTGAKQPVLETAEQFLEAWLGCQVAMDVLTSDEDGSDAATWLVALTHAVFDYETAYEAKHGYMPLNPAGAEWTDGPTGNA